MYTKCNICLIPYEDPGNMRQILPITKSCSMDFFKLSVLSSPGIIAAAAAAVVVVVAAAVNAHFYIIIIYYNAVFSSLFR